MPTYDYKCKSCGNVKEIIHSMKECDKKERNEFCEECNSEKQFERTVVNGQAPAIGLYSSASPEEKKKILKKRSHDHFEKEIKEKFHVMNSKNYKP
jgi:putative FmdB family regulatory protein